MPATVRWLGLALLGILIAAGVSIAASRLASQQIGLASEPISAGDALAPVARAHAKPPRPATRHSGKNQRTATSTTTAPPVTTVPPPQPTVPPSTSSPVPASPGGRSSGDGGDHGAGGGADD
jgi:hypothetical protein